jgi:hypothetical protein
MVPKNFWGLELQLEPEIIYHKDSYFAARFQELEAISPIFFKPFKQRPTILLLIGR